MEEIKAVDIMIGNWVNVLPHNKPSQIIEIKSGRPDYKDYVRINSPYLDTRFATEIENIKGIPLTEDILLKAGFRKRKMSGYDAHFIYSLFIGGETIGITAIYNADFSIMLHGVARGVKHLHRLQNIIKIVTGNELEINL